MSGEQFFPPRERSREIASVIDSQPASDAGLLWQHEIKNVDVTVGRDRLSKLLQNAVDAAIVDVMKEAVRQNEIEFLARRRLKRSSVGADEVSTITSLGITDVAVVPVESCVIRMLEERSIDAWPAPDIQNSPTRLQIAVTQYRLQLGANERALPESLPQHMVEDVCKVNDDFDSVGQRTSQLAVTRQVVARETFTEPPSQIVLLMAATCLPQNSCVTILNADSAEV